MTFRFSMICSKYYFEIGCFEEAKNMAQKGINTCKKLSTSESLTLNCIILLSEYYVSNQKDSELLFEDALTLLKRHKQSSTVKEQRDMIHLLAEALIASGNTEASLSFWKKAWSLAQL